MFARDDQISNWNPFLKECAIKYGLSRQEREILFLIQIDFANRKDLQDIVLKQYAIGDVTFTSRMRGIYRKFHIESKSKHTPDKFKGLIDKLNEEFKGYIDTDNGEISPTEGGIVKVCPKFPTERFEQELRKVIREPNINYKKVDILQTFIPNFDCFNTQLTECVDNKVSIRILLIWPKSNMAGYRSFVLRKYASFDTPIDVLDKVIENLETLEKIVKKSSYITTSNEIYPLQIRLYDSHPSVAIYRCGQYMLTSLFLHTSLAIDSFQLEMNLVDNPNPLVIHQLQNEFELMWNIGKDFTSSLQKDRDSWQNDLEHLFLNDN